MLPISVFIITKNEEDRIAKAINSVKSFADEILVIDSGSNDRTCEIAVECGANVTYNQWSGYGRQKIFGEELCRNDWILNIDADEELSKELAEEIEDIFQGEIVEDVAGFRIKIVNQFPLEDKPKRFAYYYNQLRLYNKRHAGFKNSAIHDSVEIKALFSFKIIQLKSIIYHASFRSYSHWIEKINHYSQMQAIDMLAKGRVPSISKIFFSPMLAFFKAWLVRRYCIYGVDGIIYSAIFAFSRFTKMIKVREMYLVGKRSKEN